MSEESSPSIEEIIASHTQEYMEGLVSVKDVENPYPQSFHFQLTVDDAKHIAWREGHRIKHSPK